VQLCVQCYGLGFRVKVLRVSMLIFLITHPNKGGMLFVRRSAQAQPLVWKSSGPRTGHLKAGGGARRESGGQRTRRGIASVNGALLTRFGYRHSKLFARNLRPLLFAVCCDNHEYNRPNALYRRFFGGRVYAHRFPSRASATSETSDRQSKRVRCRAS
jgi:hypothetical protein